MVGLLVLLAVTGAFIVWDRQLPPSATPDGRLIWVGVAFAVLGGVSSVFLWWLIVPVIVFLVGATLIVVGRHRTVQSGTG